uniref:Uncharacterized protein n=1 Tax=Anguilla anguilla TaxID=7936 RepID=A0A0E9TIT5_ANGAN
MKRNGGTLLFNLYLVCLNRDLLWFVREIHVQSLINTQVKIWQ